MNSPLTKEQQAEVTRLYRESGWSIKKIAKILHISDRRVSAFLRGKMGTAGISKPCKPSKAGKKPCCCKQKKGKKEQDPFVSMVREGCQQFEEAAYDFVAAVDSCVVEGLEDVLSAEKISKKQMAKRMEKRLNTLLESSVEMFFNAAIAMVFTMPVGFKKLWLSSIERDPKDALSKKGKSKGKKKAK